MWLYFKRSGGTAYGGSAMHRSARSGGRHTVFLEDVYQQGVRMGRRTGACKLLSLTLEEAHKVPQSNSCGGCAGTVEGNIEYLSFYWDPVQKEAFLLSADSSTWLYAQRLLRLMPVRTIM